MAEPEAAVAILRAGGPEESILLIRRAEREADPWSGHWSFPGGRRQPEDPDALHTALRELEEECGIRLSAECLEAALTPTVARRAVGPYLLVAPFVFRVEGELPAVLDSREAVEARWIRLRHLLDPAHHALLPVPGMPRELLFPAVPLNGVPLWGFTYRLIAEWLGLGPKQRPVEEAGFEAARLVLDFLLAQGLTLRQGWEDGKSATVKGTIPVAQVLARFASPGPHVWSVNRMSVRPDSIHIVGLAFEQYFIHAEAG